MEAARVKLTYVTKVKAKDRPSISSSRDAINTLRFGYDLETIEHTERMVVLLLNRANKVLGYEVISTGGQNATICDVKIIAQLAVLTHAAGVILSHNHPSGNFQPSQADRDITKKVKEALKHLDINLLDHLIVTPEMTYFSFADEGLV